jgi:preprotein translocase subunit SecG
MISVVIAFHVIVCVALIIVVLLQQGKGADMGAVFGGSSQTVFGASGAGNVLTKVTSALAVLFFATSLYLAFSSSRHATGSIFEHSNLPTVVPPVKAPAGAGHAPAGSPVKSGTSVPVAPSH